MNIGPTSAVVGSVAGSPLAQLRGPDADRNSQEAIAAERRADGLDAAEQAAGIGTADEDQAAGERDADGRRLWEAPPEKRDDSPSVDETTTPTPVAKDPSGDRGGQLDLRG